LEDRGTHLCLLSSMPPAQASTPGLSELRSLRRPPGDRNGVITSALRALGVPEEGGPIYELALTHRSFAFEQPEPLPHNERLEFLGDAVIEMVLTHAIYRDHPDMTEGELARLRASVVNMASLADLARSIELGPHIRLGRGEESSGGRDKSSLLADTFEAVVGAVYLDQGFDVARAALEELFRERVEASAASTQRYDAKTALQEMVVRRTGGAPSYRVSSSGPDHDKRFTATVFVDGEMFGSGTGRSKKEAEYQAAREALGRFDTNDPPEGGPRARAS
jgi:ribonuclease III